MPADRWLDRVDVTTRFDSAWRDADLSVRVMVSDASRTAVPGNLPGGGAPYRLRLTLTAPDGQTPDGQIIATQEQEVPGHAHTGRETTMVMHVANPRHWTAETPALYTLRTDLIGPGWHHAQPHARSAFARSARRAASCGSTARR
jgi:beta-galactosidase/beta-glucuronidase